MVLMENTGISRSQAPSVATVLKHKDSRLAMVPTTHLFQKHLGAVQTAAPNKFHASYAHALTHKNQLARGAEVYLFATCFSRLLKL